MLSPGGEFVRALRVAVRHPRLRLAWNRLVRIIKSPITFYVFRKSLKAIGVNAPALKALRETWRFI